MKISKWVELPSTEVEIEIGKDEILETLEELNADDSHDMVMRGLNTIGQFLRAISAEKINAMRAKPRETVANFLREQAQRFERPSAASEGESNG